MFFFFQAEDGIRDIGVTGVQTCALPIFPAVPLHSWLLDVYVSSPTSTNVVLSGVLPKLGTYGLIKIAIPLLPQGVEPFLPYLAILGVVNIIYGAFVAFLQPDRSEEHTSELQSRQYLVCR